MSGRIVISGVGDTTELDESYVAQGAGPCATRAFPGHGTRLRRLTQGSCPLRRDHESADREIVGERAGRPNADDRLHVGRMVEHMLGLHAKLCLPMPAARDGDGQRGEMLRRDTPNLHDCGAVAALMQALDEAIDLRLQRSDVQDTQASSSWRCQNTAAIDSQSWSYKTTFRLNPQAHHASTRAPSSAM